jgi:hypothetical protein
MFFVAFAVFLSAAIYISPMFCGSNTEKKMISKPQEIDTGKECVRAVCMPNARRCSVGDSLGRRQQYFY